MIIVRRLAALTLSTFVVAGLLALPAHADTPRTQDGCCAAEPLAIISSVWLPVRRHPRL